MDVTLIYMLLDEKPEDYLTLKGDNFKYLVKSRRHSLGDRIQFRSQESMDYLYEYEISSIENRSVVLRMINVQEKIVAPSKFLHIAWCMIDIKSIEKVLPSLNEIGVSRISFIGCDRTQRNFQPDLNRFRRILEASMQQCGRSTYIDFATFKNIQDFIKEYPDTKVFDFTERTLDVYKEVTTVLIGCEGGFSEDERLFLESKEVFRLDTPMVLRSESATVAIASKILL